MTRGQAVIFWGWMAVSVSECSAADSGRQTGKARQGTWARLGPELGMAGVVPSRKLARGSPG